MYIFDTFIYCNMMDTVVMFITLYNYSTILSIFMIHALGLF